MNILPHKITKITGRLSLVAFLITGTLTQVQADDVGPARRKPRHETVEQRTAPGIHRDDPHNRRRY